MHTRRYVHASRKCQSGGSLLFLTNSRRELHRVYTTVNKMYFHCQTKPTWPLSVLLFIDCFIVEPEIQNITRIKQNPAATKGSPCEASRTSSRSTNTVPVTPNSTLTEECHPYTLGGGGQSSMSGVIAQFLSGRKMNVAERGLSYSCMLDS